MDRFSNGWGVSFSQFQLTRLCHWIRVVAAAKRDRGKLAGIARPCGSRAIALKLLAICTIAMSLAYIRCHGGFAVACEQDVAALANSTEQRSGGDDDADQTVEGKQRLADIEKLAGQINQQRAEIERERRPFALRRDSMLVEATQARERIVQNQAAAVVTERQIAQLESQIKWTPGSLGKELRAQQTRLRTNLKTFLRKVDADRKIFDERTAQVSALNIQTASLEQRLLEQDEQLGECRQRWLAIRQPLDKYSRADFEGLRRVLDDWLVMDKQWPEAYAWAALCAYELDDTPSASAYLDKARKLQTELSGSKKSLPQLEALTGLVRRKQPGQSYKADTSITNALRLADKNASWETYFLVGRCYSDRAEDGERAMAHFQRALSISPNCDCVKLWVARLQTTSTLESVRDVYTGTSCLEQIWQKSGQRSWRLAIYLAEAYSAAKRPQDAEDMWRFAAELAPTDQQHRLPKTSN